MHLTIRWKLILSISIPLLLTYLGLLTWDYWWQREHAARQMQELVIERAQNRATELNAQLEKLAEWAGGIADSIELQPAPSEQTLKSALQSVSWQGRGDAQVIAVLNDLATAQIAQRPLGGGGRGPGGRGGPGRGGGGRPPDGPGPGGPGEPPPGPPRNPGDGRGPANSDPSVTGGARGQQFGQVLGQRGQRFGGGPEPTVESVDYAAATQTEFYKRVSRSAQAVWIPPGAEPIFDRTPNERRQLVPEPQSVLIYATPIIVNDALRGVVAVALPPQESPLSRFGGRGGRGGFGVGPATPPRDGDSPIDREFTILDRQGRIIAPAERRTASDESIFILAQKRAGHDVAHALRAAMLDDVGATTPTTNTAAPAARVVRVGNLPELVPNVSAGEMHWVALATVPETGWFVTAAISESRFLDPIVQRLWHRAMLLGSGMVVLLFVAAFVSIRISRPIERMATAVNQLASGNLDAQVSGVRGRDELAQLAGAFNTMTRQLKSHVAALTEQTAARESVEAELRIARQIQNDLLPRTFPPFPNRLEFALHAINVPAKRVAGDFFDFFFAPGDLLTVVIADVSGKGVPAALLMAVTRTIVRNLALEGMSPGQIAERTNAMLLQDTSDSMFVTMFLAQYDTRTGRIMYVNAGHPMPFRYSASGATPKHFGEITGPLLGVQASCTTWLFAQREEHLDIGETLLLYTDGVTEARAPDGAMLRDAGAIQIVARHSAQDAKGICTALVAEVTLYQANQPADDITVVALQRRS